MARKEGVKERLLRKLIPPGVIGVDGSAFTVSSGGGWDLLVATDALGTNSHWAVWRGYFDLSGIVEQQETLFTVNPMFQEGADWNFSTTDPVGALVIYDMITQEYITDATFDGAAGSGMWIPPGMMSMSDLSEGPNTGAPYELEDVHFGASRTKQLGATTTLGVSPFLPSTTNATAWGTGSATAGQKLYITRAIALDSAIAPEPGNQILCPPTAVVVPVLIAKETDLRYIERLRRSYVVQATVD